MQQDSNFSFLKDEFPLLHRSGMLAERHLYVDPSATLVKLRIFGERVTELMFQLHFLELPRPNTFHNRLVSLYDDGRLPVIIKDLLFNIKSKGNPAAHRGEGRLEEAKQVLQSAFKIALWFYETYAEYPVNIAALRFEFPQNADHSQALQKLQQEHDKLLKQFQALQEAQQHQELPAEKEEAYREKGAKAAQKLQMNEAETRGIIDQQLCEAGWEAATEQLNFKKHGTMPQKGRNMAIAEWQVDNGWADYALFIGTKLVAIVEAKRFSEDVPSALGQAKRYAKQVQATESYQTLGTWRKQYQVPFLYATNGRPYFEQIQSKSGIWFLDVRQANNIPRALQGWHSPEGLEYLLQHDLEAAETKLKETPLDFLTSPTGLGLRDYQIKAIRAVETKILQGLGNHTADLEEKGRRRALLTMATGTGKTRTIMGLCYLLIKANRFRRILFLVDRRLLAQQAFDAFLNTDIEDLNAFSAIYKVDALEQVLPDIDTRLHFATVQSMVKRIFHTEDSTKRPKIDDYDCIIVDEAHRGYGLDKEMEEEDFQFKNQNDYLSKYRQVLDFFDAYAIGLTATPALHTREVFGPAVFTYSYPEAVIDGYLIDYDPPHIIKTKFSEEGIVWEAGEKPKVFNPEENSLEELETLADELRIEIDQFNKLVISESFNKTVIQELVKHLDPESEGKTLIFCARESHANQVVRLLQEAFKEQDPDFEEESVVKITGKSDKPQELVTLFKNEKYPSIVVTVDLLTTGIDVPKICNLVFLRRVKSRILYEQMLGRATRRADDIGKESFQIFDAVRLYEAIQDFTQMKPVVAKPQTSFQQLSEETEAIGSEQRMQQQINQIIAKLQRKYRKIKGETEEQFKYKSGGQSPTDLVEELQQMSVKEAKERIASLTSLWKFLDELKAIGSLVLVHEGEDEYRGTERGFGRGKKPEDYLQSFQQYIEENRNQLAAIQLLCTRPQSLDRQSLKELRLALSTAGFKEGDLQAAWKSSKNEAIAADIIAFIRSMALGNALESKESRVLRAMKHIRAQQDWTKMQEKWLDRFEKQLLAESVLQIEDLDKDPFKDQGGRQRLDKIFNGQLESIIGQLNDRMYEERA